MSSSNNSSLIHNSFYNVLSRGFNVLYPLIVSAYLSRIFGAAGMGKIMFAINIVTYFTLAASLGIPNYAIRIIAKCRDSRDLTTKSFSEISRIIFFSSLVSSIVYYILILVLYHNDEESLIIAMALGLMVVSNITNYDWLFEAEEDFKYLAIRSILIKTVAIFLIFTMVHSKDDMILYAFLYAGITVFNNFCNAISFKKYAGLKFHSLNFKQHLSPILVLFSAAVATDVYVLLDSTMLGALADPEYLGYYSNSSRFVRASFGLLASVTGVFNPRLNYLYGNGQMELYKDHLQKFYDTSMFIAIPASFGIFFLATEIITVLFGGEFMPGVFTLKILSVLIIVFSIATVFGHCSLIVYHKERILLFATIVGAIVNFTLNFILIPRYYHNGVALASVVCEVLVTTILVIYSLRVVKIPLLNHRVIVSFFSSVIMLVPLYLFRLFISNTLLCLFVSIIVGGIAYYAICSLFNHEITYYFNVKFRNVIAGTFRLNSEE